MSDSILSLEISDSTIKLGSALSKRELFAAMAMQGFASNGEWLKAINDGVDNDGQIVGVYATLGVQAADALIEALATKDSEPIAAPLKSDKRNGGAE